jgi:hypothetical protein
LHVTNGDSVLYLFRKAGITGTHLAWRDALNEGPVPEGLSLEETSALRARYLSERGYASPIKIYHDFEVRDEVMRRAADFAEIVLWFEHDLYDQLQLLQALTTLDELALDPGRISVIQSDQYLGTMTADEISALLPRRRIATAAIFAGARRTWARFTSAQPADLFAATQEDAIGFPFLRSALRRLCEEYPGLRDGLSRTQRQALQAVVQGSGRKEDLFTRAQAREEASFHGDAGFYKTIDDLRDERAPLLDGPEGAVTITALGRRVLAGEADWLESHAIDRWIGGVHLMPGHIARWDDEAGRFAER